MKGLRSIKPLAKESLRGIEPCAVGGKMPRVEFVDPRHLFVEEDYQREILANGVTLIRKIVGNFNWARFKPPICVRKDGSGGALICIDGQHTATAAATCGLRKIPVMVVYAESVKDRATAFAGHNRDRLGLTTIMIHAAELASGEPLAVMIDEACRETGASIPRKAISTAAKAAHPVGTTISLGAIRAIAKRQGKDALVRVLKLLISVGRGPIKSVEIAAAALIFDFHPNIDDAKLARVIRQKTVEQWTAQGHSEAVETGKAFAICVACAWCRLLGVAEPDIKLKGNFTDHSRLFKTKKVEAKADAPLPPARTIVAPAPQASQPQTQPIERDGIKLDVKRRRLARNGTRVELSEEETDALAILIRVMPAMLPNDQIASKAFGTRTDASFRVRELAAGLQPKLNLVGLKLREVPKMGYALGAAV